MTSLNHKVSGREMRRHNMAIVSATEAALTQLEHNAAVDRQRIEALERRVRVMDRGFVGRMRWLVLGT